jgi:hypothetical protein
MGVFAEGGKKVGEIVGGDLGKAVLGKIGLKKHGEKWGKQLGGHIGGSLASAVPILGSMKKGGKVYKTGNYLLHKGETVVPAGIKVIRFRKSSRKKKY